MGRKKLTAAQNRAIHAKKSIKTSVKVIEKRGGTVVVASDSITSARKFAKESDMNLDDKGVMNITQNMTKKRRRNIFGTEKSVFAIDKK